MELGEFWRALSRQRILAAIVFIVCADGAAFAALWPPDQYQAVVTVGVDPANPVKGTSSDVQVVSFLMPALQAEVQSPTFGRTVRGQLPARAKAGSYAVSSAVESGTGLLVITAKSQDAGIVSTVANKYAATLITASPYHGLRIRVISAAQRPTGPEGPPRIAILVSGLALACILAVLAALVGHAASRHRRVKDEVQRRYGLAVLGNLPKLRGPAGPDIGQLFEAGRSPELEAVVDLRTRVQLSMAELGVRTLCVTSPPGRTGKSTVAAGIAYAMASAGDRVTLMECDLRRPSLSEKLESRMSTLGPHRGPGGAVPVSSVAGAASFQFISADEVRAVSASSASSSLDRHPADTIGDSLPQMITRIGSDAWTVIDAPDVEAAETRLVVSLSRATVLVADVSRATFLDDVDQAVREVRGAGGDVLGVVLNRTRGRWARSRDRRGTGQ
jgi:tyrosine-protein kinase